MMRNSEKTNQWIIGYLSFNLFVIFYIYLFFYEEWVSTIISIIIPLLVWEILIFGIMTPDEVFMEVIGNWDRSNSDYQNAASPVSSVRAVLVSSGDH